MSWAVLGAGSWGTALALVLARNGAAVRLWDHKPDSVRALREARENRRYLPGVPLPANIEPVEDLAAAVTGSAHWLIVVPSHNFRALLESLRPLLPPGQPLTWATKGLDTSGGLLHRVVMETLPLAGPLAVLSGPSFAREVADQLPTAVTVASADPGHAAAVAAAFHNESFRVYTSADIVGVELGGAVKNVLAIATGVADGLGFGSNARAALITRGLAEMSRLGNAVQADPTTLMGLSGIGDLILTCTDDQSRNRRMGLALGRGESVEAALAAIAQTVEGVRTAAEVRALADRLGIEMPICTQVDRLLRGEVSAQEAVQELMGRQPKPEF